MSKIPSLEQLKRVNEEDFKKVLNVYNQWDKSARGKDFEECERQERILKKIHDKHGIKES